MFASVDQTLATTTGGVAQHAWGAGGGPWLFGPLTFFLVIALVAVLVWFAARGEWPWRRSPVDRARQILLERYARGEISNEEYRERLEKLG